VRPPVFIVSVLRENKMVALYTERLLIRDHVLDDLETHHALLSDERAMKYLPEIKTQNREESRANLLKALEEINTEINAEKRKLYFFRIENRNTKEHIGEIGYTVKQETPRGKVVEMGYFINEKHWRKGYTTEALKRVIAYAFETDTVYRIGTGCLKENAGSEGVMKKCGLIKEAEFKEYQLHENTLKDRVEYRLLKHEWKGDR
jgi:ribosomal-protein-alanine N-acetyltransferase